MRPPSSPPRLALRRPHLRHAPLVVTLAAAAIAGSLTACGARPGPTATTASAPPPHAKPAARTPLRAAEIDAMLRAEWSKAKVTPSAEADDATFLRRVWLDLAGTVPPEPRVVAFLADTSKDKRAKVIDELLASPAYADHFTNYWDRVLLGRDARPGLVDRVAFRAWLHDRLAKNVPYDELVRELVTAEGVNSPGGNPLDELPRPGAEPTMAPEPARADMPPAQGAMDDGSDDDATSAAPAIDGAVNWYLRYADALPDLAGTTSRVFLGVQIQCAQCHDHKTEKWKTTQFQSFAACFTRTRAVPLDRGKKAKGVRRVEVRDVAHDIRLRKKLDMPEILKAPPRALDGTDFTASPNRRKALADWMTAKQNPWFARAIVNRMWSTMLGRGFAEPIDDFRESNPPVAPEILDRLARELVESGYDLKGLLRILANTEAYQLAPGVGAPGSPDDKLWAHFAIEPLGPDELLDSVVTATKLDALLQRTAGENVERVRFAMRRQFAFLFDVDEEGDHHDEFDGTIAQALFTLNGPLWNRASSALPGTTLTEVLQMRGGEAPRIRTLYLRTLSRPPTDAETARWTEFLDAPREAVVTPPPAAPAQTPAGKPAKGAGQRVRGEAVLRKLEARMAAREEHEAKAPPGPFAAKRQAYEDMLWTLLDSSEFLFNH